MKTPKQYFASLDEPHKSELKQLDALIRKAAPKLKPWLLESAHGTIVGYGRYEYTSKSGCTGEWFTVGLSSRKGYMALYICAVRDGKYLTEHYAKQLANLKMGKSCINIKSLADIDLKVVSAMVREAAKFSGSMYS